MSNIATTSRVLPLRHLMVSGSYLTIGRISVLLMLGLSRASTGRPHLNVHVLLVDVLLRGVDVTYGLSHLLRHLASDYLGLLHPA